MAAVEALVRFGAVILHMTLKGAVIKAIKVEWSHEQSLFSYLFPTLPAHFRLWAVGAVVAFLTAVEALAWLIVSSIIAHL